MGSSIDEVGTEDRESCLEDELEGDSDAIERGKTFLEEVVRQLGVEADVEAEEREDHIAYEIISDGRGLLIGRYGQTLDALQYLMARVVNKGRRQWKRVVVDTEGYRERRAEVLKRLAFRMKDKVMKTGRSVELDDMNPHDRRIIHLTLQDDPDVYTESVGESYLKYIVVYPYGDSEYDDDYMDDDAPVNGDRDEPAEEAGGASSPESSSVTAEDGEEEID